MPEGFTSRRPEASERYCRTPSSPVKLLTVVVDIVGSIVRRNWLGWTVIVTLTVLVPLPGIRTDFGETE